MLAGGNYETRTGMYAVEEHTDVEPREFYRCAVSEEKQSAKLKIGRSSIDVRVVEKSVKDCTLLVKKRYAKKLRGKGPFTLYFDGAKMLLDEFRVSKAKKGYVQVGAMIGEDLTPPEKIKSSWWPSRKPSSDNMHIVFAGFVLVLFCAMAMPGLGDRLGTADRIQNAFIWFVSAADETISG